MVTPQPDAATAPGTDDVVESGTATVVDITTGTPVEPGAQEDAPRPAGRAVALRTLRQVFAVLPLRRAVPDLVSGSWVLAGMGCGCVAHVVRWAWAQASDDPEAAAALAAHTKRAAAVAQAVDKAREEGEEEKAAAALAGLGAAPTGRRPVLEALAYLALGGMLAAGAFATLAALAVPYLTVLADWRPMILTVGGLGWSVAAWAVAPPPKAPEQKADPEDDVVQDEAEESAEGEPEEPAGTLLLWHLITALSGAESVGRAGLHLDVVLASAVEKGLLPATTEAAEWRAWVEACGIPVEDKVGYRIEGKPVTRVGVRIDAVTAALGMTPTALLTARSQTPAGGGPATPARPVGESPLPAPAQTAPEAPAPAALRLLPGGRQHPAPVPSPTAPQGSAQEAR
ncbi:hypothetical protein OG927_35870 (plasmid) [Streptomyces clavifer]|uniref:hypothetical protein n=1 Tax=Streptomyces clavifer TaxID=68188 RepID=UPI002E8017C6|nr:hypothetical protein [Streptomyces clavifer]WUC32707.1 hypothetical protein OG927_35870 [Streptomyces clavifer]